MRSARLRSRKLFVVLLAVPVLAISAIVGGIATASAVTPQLVARGDCLGHISYTATAGNPTGSTDSSRTSDTVAVAYSTAGADGPFTLLPAADAHTFTKANDFTFADSFTLPDSITRPTIITLKVVANSHSNSTIPVALPAPCAGSDTTSNVAGPSCSLASAQVVLTNNGAASVTFGFYRNDAATPFQTVSVAHGTQTVSVPVSDAFTLSVKAGDKTVTQQKVAPPAGCTPDGKTNQPSDVTTTSTTVPPTTTPTTQPAAPVANAPGFSAGCAANAQGWTITFDNSKGTGPIDYLIRDDLGNNVDSTIVEAGKSVTKQYPFANVKGSALAIVVGGKVLAVGDAKTVCVNVGATIESACNTAAGNGILLGFTDTGKVNETFTVTRDGKDVDGSPFTIPPSGLVTQKLLPLTSGSTATIKVVGSSGFVLEKSVTVNCVASTLATAQPPQVLGNSQSRSQLAYTGFDAWPYALLAVGLSLLGASFVHSSRRRRQA